MIEQKPTKQLLLESLKELMDKEAFKDITVQEIAKNASITTRTFYNHFYDKYDLLRSGLKQIITNSIVVTANDVKWSESAEKILNQLYENRSFIKSATSYIGQNDFREILRESCEKAYLMWIDASDEVETSESDKISFAVRFFSYGYSDLIYEWCMRGFTESPKEMAAKFQVCLPAILQKYFIA